MKTELSGKITMRVITLTVLFLTILMLPATETVSTDSIEVNPPTTLLPIEILEPDYYNWDITYSWTENYENWSNQTTNGRLVEVLEPPTCTIAGPSTFTDGTVAPQTCTISFKGIWHLDGAAIFNGYPGHVYTAEVYHVTTVSLTFGLTADTGEGAHWRAMNGAFPRMAIEHPMAPVDSFIYDPGFGLSLGFNNDLDYTARQGNDRTYTDYHQALSTSACNSPYPIFVFVGHYGESHTEIDMPEYQRSYSYALTLLSGKAGDPNSNL